MRTFINFVLLVIIAGLTILMGIMLGDKGPWYFAWILGTVVIVLVSAAAGVMLDAQDAIAARKNTDGHQA